MEIITKLCRDKELIERKRRLMNSSLATVLAILALLIIECIALYHGINGKLMLIVVCCISGLGGYSFRDVSDVMRKKNGKVRKNGK